jgi:putative ABC transport system permease protein
MPLYRFLLRLCFPAAFRRRFGEDMAETFADRLREARRRGRAQVLRTWIRTTADAVRQGLAEHRVAARRDRATPGRLPMLETLAQDLRHGWRSVRRRPAFTATAVLTLALGIGVNVAIFSVLDGVLIRWLPLPDADRIVRVAETGGPDDAVQQPFNAGNFVDVRGSTGAVFQALAAYTRQAPTTLTGTGEAVRVPQLAATPELFDVMAVPPALGRPLTAADTEAGTRSIVVSMAFWRGKLGGDPGAVGRAIELDGQPWTVVGVMPAGIAFPEETDIWKPLIFRPAELSHRNVWNYAAVGRLRPGVTLAQANAALQRAMTEVARTAPGPMPRSAEALDLREDTVSRVRPDLYFVQGVAILILLIACANLANLLLADATSRRAEFSIRAAMGAGRRRLVRQVLAESLTLSAAGSALGVVLASWLVPVLVTAYPGALPGRERIAVSIPELIVAGGCAGLTALVFGLAPAVLGSRADLMAGLHATTRIGVSRRMRWLRSGLIVAEGAITLSLLAGGALLIRSFATLTAQPVGFDASNVMTARISLPAARFTTDVQRRTFFDGLLARLGREPDVAAEASTFPLPFDGGGMGAVYLRDPADSDTHPLVADLRYVSPGYLDTLHVPLRRGRFFTEADAAGRPLVAVANETFDRQYGATRDVVGMRFRPAPDAPWITIVGVVGDVRAAFLRKVRPQLMFPFDQSSQRTTTVVVRTRVAAARFAPRLRALVREMDPDLALTNVEPLTTVVGDSVARQRFNMALMVALASLAVVLVAVGIYGVVAYLVGQRTREVGIRLALGARPGQVQALVVRQGLVPILAGIGGGLGGAWYLTTLLRTQLFEVRPHDPWALAAAAGGFFLVGLAACWLPSRRTSRVDPVTVLRTE